MLVIDKQMSGSQKSLSLKKQAFVSNPSESSSGSKSSGKDSSEQELDIEDDNTRDGHADASRTTSQFSAPEVQEFEDELCVDKCSTYAGHWNEKERGIE